jgi:hypothetical protein
MPKTVFGVDDIHKLRLETAERYANMSKEEARRDLHQRAENTRRAIEEIRHAKQSGIYGFSIDNPATPAVKNT